MYNLLIALGLSAVVFTVVALLLAPLPAILPALLVFGVSLFLLTRRVSSAVEAEIAGLVPLLQARKIKEARALLERIKASYGSWQFYLSGQLDAQIGMIEYLQLKWDKALPLLEKGRWRNWTALLCIGAIHFRKGELDKAWATFEEAAGAAPKQVMVYVVWATLLARKGRHEAAMKVVSDGLSAIDANNAVLVALKGTIANKKKIDVRKFPELWYQFFPEDAAQMAGMRGRRGQQMPSAFPQPRMKGKMARRR